MQVLEILDQLLPFWVGEIVTLGEHGGSRHLCSLGSCLIIIGWMIRLLLMIQASGGSPLHLQLLALLLLSLLLQFGEVDLVLSVHEVAELLNLRSQEFFLLLFWIDLI